MTTSAPTCNYFWDANDPDRPFTFQNICNTYSLVPDNATRIAPKEYTNGFIPCWDGEAWVNLFDWRKVQLWEKETGKEFYYPYVTMDPNDADKYTQLCPQYPFAYWENNAWVRNTEKEAEYNCEQLAIERKRLLLSAKDEIALFENIVLAKESMEAEDIQYYKDLLKAWKIYSGNLALMKFKTGEETFPDRPKTAEETLDL